MISGAFAEALRARRDRYNALFAAARRSMPQLDGGAFAGHLRSAVAPVVEAVARTSPERSGEVADVLYEFSLELAGRGILERHTTLAPAWSALLSGLPGHLGAEPRLFAGSVTNALLLLTGAPGARPREWCAEMLRLGRLADAVPDLLAAGRVLAWRAGLARFRAAALETCRSLPPILAFASLGLPAAAPEQLPPLLARLEEDPWLDPAAAAKAPAADRRLRIVRRAGGFRGFGGPFLRPPRVTFADGHFLTTDGEATWVLYADLFGADFLRTAAHADPDPTYARDFAVDRGGLVRREREQRAFPELRSSTSAAAGPGTLAVTVPVSHAVYLVALAGASACREDAPEEPV